MAKPLSVVCIIANGGFLLETFSGSGVLSKGKLSHFTTPVTFSQSNHLLSYTNSFVLMTLGVTSKATSGLWQSSLPAQCLLPSSFLIKALKRSPGLILSFFMLSFLLFQGLKFSHFSKQLLILHFFIAIPPVFTFYVDTQFFCYFISEDMKVYASNLQRLT